MTSAAAPAMVSVVMIFRDAQAYFEEAITSVLHQTHPSLELLLCDDGSTDASTATARRYARENPGRVRYLEHPGHAHRGTGSTRNLGIAAARGLLVAFLDADDVWEPGHLAHEVALLNAHPEASVVCGRALNWYSWEGSGADDRLTPLPWPAGTLVPPPRMLSAVLRRGAYTTPTCSLLVRREVLEEVGGVDDSFSALFEDQVLLAKLYLSQTCVISGATTALYRRHAASSTAVAHREGSYDPGGPNRSHQRFVRWLAQRPELSSSEPSAQRTAAADAEWAELRELLELALAPYEQAAEGSPSRRRLVRGLVPTRARPRLRRAFERAPALASVWPRRRLEPVSRHFGYDRGLPVDRYHIERFLAEHAQLVAGRVLEVGDAAYTHRFGGGRVTQSDVLNIDASIPGTTITADLADAGHVPSESFDCLIVTQTLHLVYDMPAAVRTLHRILKPGGTLLLTVPGITPVAADRWAATWYWSVTQHGARRLFNEAFGDGEVEVAACGNVLTTVAFLEGMAAHELTPTELQTVDPQYPMVVTVRADRACAA